MSEAGFGWRFTAPLMLGSTLNPINSSLIATGLVGIGASMHAGPGATASLISVLYLCSAVAQPTMGKLATVFGPRRIFLIGIVIVLAGGVIGAAAPSFGVLLVSRALIGIGTSAGYPTAMALVRARADRIGGEVPSRVLGNFSIAAQITVVFGLPLGGVLVGAFGWRALFAVNIPLAVLTFGMTIAGVAPDRVVRRRGDERLARLLDLPGIALFAGAIAALLVFLAGLRQPAWWLAAVAALLVAMLLAWEWRARFPLLDLRMLARNRALQRTYGRQALAALGMYMALYGVSQWMEQSARFSASAVGLTLLPLSVLSILVARVVSRRGWLRWPLIVTGAGMVLVGGVLLTIDRHGPPLVPLLAVSLLLGLANGCSSFANQAVLYIQTPAAEIAVASGLFRTFSYFGAIFSASLIGLSFGPSATDAGLHRLAWLFGGVGLALLLLTAADRQIPHDANKTTKGTTSTT